MKISSGMFWTLSVVAGVLLYFANAMRITWLGYSAAFLAALLTWLLYPSSKEKKDPPPGEP